MKSINTEIIEQFQAYGFDDEESYEALRVIYEWLYKVNNGEEVDSILFEKSIADIHLIPLESARNILLAASRNKCFEKMYEKIYQKK